MHIKCGILLGLMAGSCACLGQPEVYLGIFQFNQGRVSAFGLDGSNGRTLFSMPTAYWLPNGLAFRASDQRFFWVNSTGPSEVLSSDVAGASVTSLASVGGTARGTSLDAQGRIYFGVNNTIRRVNANGSGLSTLFTSSALGSVGAPRVDATNGHVYFGDQGEIKRVSLSGTNVKTVVRGCGIVRAVSLDIAAGKVYWVDSDTNSDYIGRANLDGSGVEIIYDNSPSVARSSGLNDLIVIPGTGEVVFVDDLNRRVMKVSVSGGQASVLHQVTGDAYPSGIALSTGDIVQAVRDCNGNGVPDDADIQAGAPDCDGNGVPDTCQSNPCPTRNFLLDQGDDAADALGRAVGGAGYSAYQPFDVPSPGWDVKEIGLGGYTYNYHDGSGYRASLFVDDGTGTGPHESTALASATGNLRFSVSQSNWVYVPMAAWLPQGRYWLRVSSVAVDTYNATVDYGTSGLGSRLRRLSDPLSAPGRPMAVRVVGAVGCPADFNADGFVDGFDYDEFVACFEGAGCPPGRNADFNGDGFADGFDYDEFVSAFENAC